MDRPGALFAPRTFILEARGQQRGGMVCAGKKIEIAAIALNPLQLFLFFPGAHTMTPRLAHDKAPRAGKRGGLGGKNP